MEAEAGVVGMEAGGDTLAGLLVGAGVGITVGMGTTIMVGMGATMAGVFIHTGAITRIIGGGRIHTTQGGLMGTMPDGLTKGGPTIQRG
jgi:hypothetical protein